MTLEYDHSRIPAILSPESFAHEIRTRGLPIRDENARRFSTYVLSQFPPSNFLGRIAAGIQYVDKKTHSKYIHLAAGEIKRSLHTPFYIAVTDSPSSGTWMYE